MAAVPFLQFVIKRAVFRGERVIDRELLCRGYDKICHRALGRHGKQHLRAYVHHVAARELYRYGHKICKADIRRGQFGIIHVKKVIRLSPVDQVDQIAADVAAKSGFEQGAYQTLVELQRQVLRLQLRAHIAQRVGAYLRITAVVALKQLHVFGVAAVPRAHISGKGFIYLVYRPVLFCSLDVLRELFDQAGACDAAYKRARAVYRLIESALHMQGEALGYLIVERAQGCFADIRLFWRSDPIDPVRVFIAGVLS